MDGNLQWKDHAKLLKRFSYVYYGFCYETSSLILSTVSIHIKAKYYGSRLCPLASLEFEVIVNEPHANKVLDICC